MSRRAGAREAAKEFETYVAELIAQRRGDPRDDLASALIAAESEGRPAQRRGVRPPTCSTRCNGGIDTTRASSRTHPLVRRPPRPVAAAGARIRAGAAAVDEILRFEPVAPFTTRVLLEDVEHRDIALPRPARSCSPPRGTPTAKRMATSARPSSTSPPTAERQAAHLRRRAAASAWAPTSRAPAAGGPRVSSRSTCPTSRLDGGPVFGERCRGTLAGLRTLPVRSDSAASLNLNPKRTAGCAFRCLGRARVNGASTVALPHFAAFRRLPSPLDSARVRCARRTRPTQARADAGRRGGNLHASIRRTAHGIPHIIGDDFADLGYGYGYAFAQDNICAIAEHVRDGPRRALEVLRPGRDATSSAATARRQQPQLGLLLPADHRRRRSSRSCWRSRRRSGRAPRSSDGVRGYVAGYNRYLARHRRSTASPTRPAAARPGSRRSPRWTSTGASTSWCCSPARASAIDGIARRAPPTGAGRSRRPPTRDARDGLRERLPARRHRLQRGRRSAATATTTAHGHAARQPALPVGRAPSASTRRSSRSRASSTSPGGGLFGVPLVLIGHNDDLAWSHTVSTAYRFTPFQLTLVPAIADAATSYDGQPEADDARRRSPSACRPAARPRTRTLCWTALRARCSRRCSAIPLSRGRRRPPSRWATPTRPTSATCNHFFEIDRAQTRPQARPDPAALPGHPVGQHDRRRLARARRCTPTSASIPNVSDAKAQRVQHRARAARRSRRCGLPVLDGSRSSCDWDNDPDAVEPGDLRPVAPAVTCSATTTSTNSND